MFVNKFFEINWIFDSKNVIVSSRLFTSQYGAGFDRICSQHSIIETDPTIEVLPLLVRVTSANRSWRSLSIALKDEKQLDE